MGLQDNSVKRSKDSGNALERYCKSFFHALNGIGYCMKYEHNMIIIALATIVAICLGFLFRINSYEWLFVITICGLVAAVEMINSAIEAAVDLVTVEKNPLAKIAKDTASSASLTLSIVAFIGALIIFLPKIIDLF